MRFVCWLFSCVRKKRSCFLPSIYTTVVFLRTGLFFVPQTKTYFPERSIICTSFVYIIDGKKIQHTHTLYLYTRTREYRDVWYVSAASAAHRPVAYVILLNALSDDPLRLSARLPALRRGPPYSCRHHLSTCPTPIRRCCVLWRRCSFGLSGWLCGCFHGWLATFPFSGVYGAMYRFVFSGGCG